MTLLTDLFLMIARMSLKAIPVILVLFLLRGLLCKAPKAYSYALWAVAAFRLLCPVAPGSVLSLFNAATAKTGESQIQIQITALPNLPQTPAQTKGVSQTVEAPAVPAADTAAAPPAMSFNWESLLALLWMIGVAVVVVYLAVRLLQLRRRTRYAVRLEGNVWLCENIPGPFVFGLLRPRIFLPVWLEGEQRVYVLAHERYHLKRRDPWAKALCQLVLALHWFNPAVWLMLWAVDRDMELSCDEGALKALGLEHGKNYSRTLLALAARRRDFGPVLAFGTPAVKQRIVNALNCGRTGKAAVALALTVLMIAGLTCCTDAKVQPQEEDYAQRLWEARTEYVGDNSAVSNLVDIILESEDCYLDSMELYTNEAPYGMHLNLGWKQDYDALREDSEAFLRSQFRVGVLLLALVDNLDYVEDSAWGLSGTESVELFRYPNFSTNAAEVLLGIGAIVSSDQAPSPLKACGQSPERLQTLLDMLEQVNVKYMTQRLLESNYTLVESGSVINTPYCYWSPEDSSESMLFLKTGESAEAQTFLLSDAGFDGFALGKWEESEGVVICTAYDGRSYRFERLAPDFLVFSAKGSAPLNAPDRAGFRQNTSDLSDAVPVEPVERRYTMFAQEWQASDHFVPRVLLRSDGTFTFVHSLVSSQFYTGIYEESDGVLTLTSDSGLVWRFSRFDADRIDFIAEGSSPLDQYADFDLLVEDGVDFQANSWNTDYLMEAGSFESDSRVMPYLRLYTDGYFRFSTSTLREQGFNGTYEEADGLLTLCQHNSTNAWQFRRIDDSTLQFVAAGSSDLGQVPEYDVPIEDGALFTAQLYPIP